MRNTVPKGARRIAVKWRGRKTASLRAFSPKLLSKARHCGQVAAFSPLHSGHAVATLELAQEVGG